MEFNRIARAAVLAFSFILSSCVLVFAGDSSLAPTPPMGWNSWDSYGRTITEAQVRGNADWMAKNLKRFGWQYVVIDEGWYVVNPAAEPKEYIFLLDGNGRFIPAPERYEWRELGLADENYKLRDLWEHRNLGKAKSLTVKLQPHASVLYRLESR